jgi:H+/Cl- antiporter ClcA
MQSSAYTQKNTFKDISISVLLGFVIGLLTFGFVKSLERIAELQKIFNAELKPVHLILLPLGLFFLILLKKRTLYFPAKIAELTYWKTESSQYWSVGMTFFHFFGTLLSHIAGASVGRESSVVLFSAGLIRILNLNWKSWGVVAMGCGFAAILGHPWIGLVFIVELFQTTFLQKIFVLISSYVATLILQTLGVHPLLNTLSIQTEMSFSEKFIFIFVLATASGLLMRIYKWAYFYLNQFFLLKSIWFRLFGAFSLMGLLAQPIFLKYQSLGLEQIQDLIKLEPHFLIPILKLAFTLFSVALGFWGGEFIPLFVSGIFFGASWAHILHFDVMLGIYLGSYLLFAGATRLKWTSFFLILGLFNWTWTLWIYFLVTITLKFSGNLSLYRQND